jgi:hypothetical protein
LESQVGRGVDQQIALGQPQHNAASRPFVVRIIAGTHRAAAPNSGNADRCSSAQQYQLTANILRDRRVSLSQDRLRD